MESEQGLKLTAALRGTAAVRDFRDDPVSDETLFRILDTARFAPSGGNRQGWRVIVVRDPKTKQQMHELYLPGCSDYLALGAAGLVPWAPLTDSQAEAAALAVKPRHEDVLLVSQHMVQPPALLVVLGDLRLLAAADRDQDRYTFAGGASVYPFIWSILLAAHEEGLGGVMMTMHIHQEARVKKLLEVPDHQALASVVILGHPVRRPTRLRRAPVSDFATFDTYDGDPVGPEAR